MTKLTFGNYQKLLFDGAKIVWDLRIAKVEANSKWVGGFVVEGRSITNLMEEYEVFLLVK
jgi:hypothetical protein